jgi:hypothetical protein
MYALVMALRSRLDLEITRVLEVLLVFSADASVTFEIGQYPEIIKELLLLWDENLSRLDGGSSTDEIRAPGRFWTYKELFELEEAMETDTLNPLCQHLLHTIPPTIELSGIYSYVRWPF